MDKLGIKYGVGAEKVSITTVLRVPSKTSPRRDLPHVSSEFITIKIDN